MKKVTTLFVLIFITISCSKSKPLARAEDGQIQKLRTAIQNGNYEEGLKLSKDIVVKVPPSGSCEEALYLQGYILSYGKSEFQGARTPLKQLLDLYPKGSFALATHKLMADCQYWQGHYNHAIADYKNLGANYGESGLSSYAQLQIANSLLLDEKVGDALTTYRELVEKHPLDPLSDSAQLMIANTYLKLQNLTQAKSELQKLMSFTQNKDLQRSAQNSLRQMEEEEPFRKGVGVPQ